MLSNRCKAAFNICEAKTHIKVIGITPKAFHDVLTYLTSSGRHPPGLLSHEGSEFINSELGMTLADATVDQLGTCRLDKTHRLRSENGGLPEK